MQSHMSLPDYDVKLFPIVDKKCNKICVTTKSYYQVILLKLLNILLHDYLGHTNYQQIWLNKPSNWRYLGEIHRFFFMALQY